MAWETFCAGAPYWTVTVTSEVALALPNGHDVTADAVTGAGRLSVDGIDIDEVPAEQGELVVAWRFRSIS